MEDDRKSITPFALHMEQNSKRQIMGIITFSTADPGKLGYIYTLLNSPAAHLPSVLRCFRL